MNNFNINALDVNSPFSCCNLQGRFSKKSIKELAVQIFPLTNAYRDRSGRVIQIWSIAKDQMVGIINFESGEKKIINQSNIVNPLNHKEQTSNLYKRLYEASPFCRWEFTLEISNQLTIWPRLEGGVQDGPAGCNQKQNKQAKAALEKVTKELGIPLTKDIRQEFHGEITGRKLNYKGLIEAAKFMLDPSGERRQLPRKEAIRPVKEEAQRRKDHRPVNEKTNQVALRIFGRGGPGFGPGSPGSGGSPKDPFLKNFLQLLQQTRLTSSYNTNNPGNPASGRQGTQGSIGGVACSLDFIEGLFDSSESIFEGTHYFCLPCVDGNIPLFKDSELKQILRELAVGVYQHSTIPFFSLHFKQGSADLFPVIHPIYQNTLVGRVIGMLDYFMKGYLNGALFTEEFIDKWYQNPSWKKTNPSPFEQLIDLQGYCERYLDGEDKKYLSVKSFQQIIEQLEMIGQLERSLGRMLSSNNRVLDDFEGFHNSFRIIAKQNSFRKEGSLFHIDTDFDVKYTIEPSPQYKESLETYFREHGSMPDSYTKLVTSYEFIAKQIHDHMVKMPLCKHYFGMLGVINFFSSYFSTLKKHRKTPILFPMQRNEKLCCPPLFPHLPIEEKSKEALKVNIYQVVSNFFRAHQTLTRPFFSGLFRFLLNSNQVTNQSRLYDTRTAENIKTQLAHSYYNNILSKCTPPFKRYISQYAEAEVRQLARRVGDELFNSFFTIIEANVNVVRNRLDSYRLRQMREAPQELIDQMIATLENACIECFRDNNTEVALTEEMPYSALKVASEASESIKTFNKRVVGGCGMQLLSAPLKQSDTAQRILDSHWDDLLVLPSEQWGVVDVNGENFGVFSLAFEDVPSILVDDYDWMSTLLENLNEQQIENRDRLVEAIAYDDKESYDNLIAHCSSSLKDLKLNSRASLLHIASLQKEPHYLKSLLNKGLSPREKDFNGFTPLHYAVMGGHLANVSILLQSDSSLINEKNKQGMSPLFTAIQHQHTDIIDHLLQRDAEPCLTVNGYNDLHCALHDGNEVVLERLLREPRIVNTCINECCEEGGTPLMMATELGKEELVNTLLAKGADPLKKRRDGVTTLEIAIRCELPSLVKALLSRVAPDSLSIEAACQVSTPEIMKLILLKPGVMDYRNLSRDNLLHIALRHGNIPVAILLAQKNNFTTHINIENETPFRLSLKLGVWEVAEELYKKGARIDLDELIKIEYHPLVKKIFNNASPAPEERQRLLLEALRKGNNLLISQVLIPLGASLDSIVGERGYQSAHYLAQSDHIFLFRSVMKRSNDFLMSLVQEGNKTLPYIAAENNSMRVLSMLLNIINQKQISLENHYFQRHLFYPIIESGSIDMIEKALRSHPEARDAILGERGIKAVHLAACSGSIEKMECLDNLGVNWNSLDDAGHSPLFFSIRGSHKEAVAFLLSKEVPILAVDFYTAASLRQEEICQILKNNASHQFTQALDQALILSAQNHNPSAFFILRQLGASLSARHSTGESLLTIASRLGIHEIVEIILEHSQRHGIPINGNEALEIACREGYAHCASLLLSKSFTLSATVDRSYLSRSIQKVLNENRFYYPREIQAFLRALKNNNQEQVLETLQTIQRDSKLNNEKIYLTKEKLWAYPLHIALILGSPSVIETIVQLYHSELSNLGNYCDSNGNTTAHLLIKKKVSPLLISNLDLQQRNYQGESPLHIAAKTCDAPMLTLIIRAAQTAIEYRDFKGRTPLFYAIIAGKKENVTALLEAGAFENQKDYQLTTPLFYACQCNFLGGVKALVRKGANLDARNQSHQSTALQFAIANDQREISRFLILEGADVNIELEKGINLIHLSAQNGNTELMQLLFGRNISLQLQDNEGKEPIHYAALQGKPEILKAIASLDERNKRARLSTPIFKEGALGGATPLHLAALSGNMESVEWLLNQKVQSDVQCTSGFDAQAFACMGKGNSSMIEMLSAYKFSREPQSLTNAMILALHKDNLDILILLLDQGVDVHSYLQGKKMPLHIASENSALHCTAYLLQLGADPFIETDSNENAFEIATRSGSYEQLQLLLDYADLDINRCFHMNRSLLHIASIHGMEKNACLLLTLGADINQQDVKGFTPLHYAIKKKSRPLISLFLGCDAALDKKSISQEKAVDLIGNTDFDIRRLYDARIALKNNAPEDSRLHLAIRENNLIAVMVLSQLDPIGERNNEGHTPLDIATTNNRQEIKRQLLKMSRLMEENFVVRP